MRRQPRWLSASSRSPPPTRLRGVAAAVRLAAMAVTGAMALRLAMVPRAATPRMVAMAATIRAVAVAEAGECSLVGTRARRLRPVAAATRATAAMVAAARAA